MSRRSSQRVEDLLRSAVPGARREPSPALREQVSAAIESAVPGTAPADHGLRALTRTPSPGAPLLRWRTRVWRSIDVPAAATGLIGVLLAVIALVGVLREGTDPSGAKDMAGGSRSSTGRTSAFDSMQGSSTPGVIAQLARVSPQNVHAAVDLPLLSELGHIAEDATRAARFLVGRLPEALVTSPTSDTAN